MGSSVLSILLRSRLTHVLWYSTVKSLIPFLIFDGWQFSDLATLPLPLCPPSGQVDKKAHMLPTLAVVGSSNLANHCQHEGTLTQAPPSNNYKSPSQSPLPDVSSYFQTHLGVALLSQESLIVWVINLAYPLGPRGNISLDIRTTKWNIHLAPEECPQDTPPPSPPHHTSLTPPCFQLVPVPYLQTPSKQNYIPLSWVGSWPLCAIRLGEAQLTRALLCPRMFSSEHFLPGTTFTFLPIAKSRLMPHAHMKLSYWIISSIITCRCHLCLLIPLLCSLGVRCLA